MQAGTATHETATMALRIPPAELDTEAEETVIAVHPPVEKLTTRPNASVIHFLAGGFGGFAGAFVTCPLEVVKTRLQSSQSARMLTAARETPGIFKGQLRAATGAMVSVYRTEGLFALWRGIGPTLAGVVPSRAIHFSSYQWYKKQLLTAGLGDRDEHGQQQESSLVHMLAAAGAGVTVATFTCPFWVVKTRMQLQGSQGDARLYRNSWDCVTKLVRKEGIRGLYRGLAVSYFGVAESTLQFVLYEKLKQLRAQHKSVDSVTPEWLELFTMAASAKLVASILTYPHEVLRTRMREPPPPGESLPRYHSVRQSFMLMLKEEGPRSFYGGLGAHLLRVVPNAAIMFLGYELFVKAFS